MTSHGLDYDAHVREKCPTPRRCPRRLRAPARARHVHARARARAVPATTASGADDMDARETAATATASTDDRALETTAIIPGTDGTSAKEDARAHVLDANAMNASRLASLVVGRAGAAATASSPSAKYASVRVLQLNCLADALAANDSFASSYYAFDGEEPPKNAERLYDLNFDKRGKDLIKTITTGDSTTSPDVVCLQEVDHYYDFFEPELRKLGYAGIYKEDQWSPCRKFEAPCDGVAIFYKTDRLELLSSHAPGAPRARKEDPAQDAGKTLMARFRLKRDPKTEGTIRNTLGTLIRGNAKPVFSGVDLQEVIVVTTHLDSSKNVDGIITRLEQTKELCRHLNAFATNLCADVDNVQIIIAGDLNATPNEACVVHLRGRGMRDAYKDITSASGDEDANKFTTWKTRTGLFKTGEVKHTIDYILYSAHRGAKVVSVAKLPSESDIPSETGLPTHGFPSDHLPLQAQIALPARASSPAPAKE